jgi:hypothetical protein
VSFILALVILALVILALVSKWGYDMENVATKTI